MTDGQGQERQVVPPGAESDGGLEPRTLAQAVSIAMQGIQTPVRMVAPRLDAPPGPPLVDPLGDRPPPPPIEDEDELTGVKEEKKKNPRPDEVKSPSDAMLSPFSEDKSQPFEVTSPVEVKDQAWRERSLRAVTFTRRELQEITRSDHTRLGRLREDEEIEFMVERVTLEGTDHSRLYLFLLPLQEPATSRLGTTSRPSGQIKMARHGKKTGGDPGNIQVFPGGIGLTVQEIGKVIQNQKLTKKTVSPPAAASLVEGDIQQAKFAILYAQYPDVVSEVAFRRLAWEPIDLMDRLLQFGRSPTPELAHEIFYAHVRENANSAINVSDVLATNIRDAYGRRDYQALAGMFAIGESLYNEAIALSEDIVRGGRGFWGSSAQAVANGTDQGRAARVASMNTDRMAAAAARDNWPGPPAPPLGGPPPGGPLPGAQQDEPVDEAGDWDVR
ncbi:hypothetical protein [Streptomyces sp. NPDC048419]|uniref:hypothetical protein n=1 Tax=Streptomyces sp. NPDC048419 TaxID=3365547 RepID=UPI003715FC26